ncbi:MAG: hypothetical protein COV33_02275 [Candidatus Zambryskibacteria bacterium CG10_big_fil_rev_8_21_14_0_10_34_34]|uniref:Hydrolase TatD n=1 Tax=Candidatus Zambryskibacteria bacterium CG10_big_fil_rev_8_21_14_0_10_34_34 TaxID=1975114 RepID=A0A2H0R0D4_9BACT|nr:MAG: hypothetical protein COV33_02275 [Candidatus Zambryskibacteria bacterium CG10_big_fil_rev_8_21_14_0_10_34_34]
MRYIDIHCHLDSLDYDSDREEVLARMGEREIGAITIGADLESSKKAVDIAEQNENVWACIGVHPNHLIEKPDNIQKSQGEPLGVFFQGFPLEFSSLNIREVETNSPGELFDKEKFSKLVKNPKVVGIGECGLDYFRIKNESEKEKQKKLFQDQIEFAIKHNKLLMLHIRNAYDDSLDILGSYKKTYGEKLKGNVHFFAGDVSVAKKFLDIGFSMSFTGVITFTHDYDEVIKFIPQDSIMTETDAPWVAPIPFRGKRNEPSYVIEVIKKLAEIRGENVEVLNNQILENAKRVFGI